MVWSFIKHATLMTASLGAWTAGAIGLAGADVAIVIPVGGLWALFIAGLWSREFGP